MIAGAPALERSLRGRIRSELRRSKALWREFKIHKKSRPRIYKSGWLARLLAPGIGLAVAALARDPGPVLLVLASLALYASGSALLRAAELLRGLWASPDLLVLSQYPVSDADFFDLQWRKFLRSSGWIFYTFALLYGSTAGIRLGTPAAVALASGLAALQWLLVIGPAAALAAWKPQWRLQFFGMALCAASALVLFFHQFTAPWIATSSGKSFLALPAGWVTLAFRDGVLGASLPALAWATPALLAAILLLAARRRLRGRYQVWEIRTQRPAAEMILEYRARQQSAQDRREPAAVARQEYLRSVPLDNQDRIRDGAFLPLLDWSREGLLERLFTKTLTHRERIVAELMAGPRLRLTRKWKTAAGLALAGIVIALSTPSAPQGLLLVLAGFFALTALHGGWPGFNVVPSAGKFMPIYAVQPVEYGEISRIFFKMTAIRIAAWTPLAAALGAALGHRAPMLGATAGLAIGLKAAWIALSAQPVVMLARFSSGTNDTERLGFRGCFGFILPFLILGLPGLAGIVCTFALPKPWWLIGAAATPLFAWALWAFYGALYNRGRIDLVRSTSGTNS